MTAIISLCKACGNEPLVSGSKNNGRYGAYYSCSISCPACATESSKVTETSKSPKYAKEKAILTWNSRQRTSVDESYAFVQEMRDIYGAPDG